MNNQPEKREKQVMKLNLHELRQAAAEFPTLLPTAIPAGESHKDGVVAGSKAQETPLNCQFVFQMTVILKPPLVLENTPRGTRQILAATGGRLVGPAIAGELLPGTTDWPCMRVDGVAELDARVAVRLDDEHLLYIAYPGYFIASPEVRDRLLAGK